jgi:type IV secretory pathway VirB2 component (pilin)
MPETGRTGQRKFPLLPVSGKRRCVMKRNMIRGLASAVILATSMIAHPHPAASQMMRSCAGRSEVVNFLDKNFAEKLTAVGLINENAMLEVYAAQSGTWTLLITNVGGVSCILLSGDSWETMPALPGIGT